MATARTYPVQDGLTALKLAGTIQQIIQSEGQGKLGIKTSEEKDWTLFFSSGRVVWAAGGEHRWRRWYRQLRQLRIHPHSIEAPIVGYPPQLEHFVLTQLYKQRRITRKSMQFAIDNTVNEVLFDAFLAAPTIIEVSCSTEEQELPESPVTVLGSYDECIARAHASLRAWQATELGQQSPNWAPAVNDEGLRQHGRALPQSHERFLNILNGKRSIRDLSIKVQKDLNTLARLLAIYHEKGIIAIQPVADLPQPQLGQSEDAPSRSDSEPTITFGTPADASASASASVTVGVTAGVTAGATAGVAGGAVQQPSARPEEKPLVVCVDDSPQICYLMEQMLTEAGYDVICIQEAVEAVSTVMRRKPAFIFLDLVMPVASGYELCKQIRRVSSFKNIPIAILTGNDGVIDRVRAKMVGATDFVSKPVKADKILPLLERHLSATQEPALSA